MGIWSLGNSCSSSMGPPFPPSHQFLNRYWGSFGYVWVNWDPQQWGELLVLDHTCVLVEFFSFKLFLPIVDVSRFLWRVLITNWNKLSFKFVTCCGVQTYVNPSCISCQDSKPRNMVAYLLFLYSFQNNELGIFKLSVFYSIICISSLYFGNGL